MRIENNFLVLVAGLYLTFMSVPLAQIYSTSLGAVSLSTTISTPVDQAIFTLLSYLPLAPLSTGLLIVVGSIVSIYHNYPRTSSADKKRIEELERKVESLMKT
jgi:hypothetical protein